MTHPAPPAIDTEKMRDDIHAALGRIGQHLIRFGEQLRSIFGAISESFASYLGIKPSLTRTELRIIRTLERPSRRVRRAERRQRLRKLAAQRAELCEAAREHRRHVRAQQRQIHRLRYRGHPARTSRLARAAATVRS